MMRFISRRLSNTVRIRGRLVLMALGFEFYQTDRFFRNNEDRRILETQILPWYGSRPELRSVVFTGAQWYTRGYRHLFKGKSWRVIEVIPQAARWYGGPGAITGSVADIASWYEPGSLDLILFTGVFGYGLNSRDDLDRTLAGMHRCLRSGGELLFSWDDRPETCPFDPRESPELQNFERLICPVLGTDHVQTSDPWRKNWIFLRKA